MPAWSNAGRQCPAQTLPLANTSIPDFLCLKNGDIDRGMHKFRSIRLLKSLIQVPQIARRRLMSLACFL